jgi:hypothetical protein
MTPPSVLPKPDGMLFEPVFPKKVESEFKLPVKTHGAVLVNVQVNVMDILKVSLADETFTAVFTLKLFYVDPALRDFKKQISYRNDDDEKCDVEGVVVGYVGYDRQTDVVVRTELDGRVLDMPISPTMIMHMTEPDWEKGAYFKPEWSMMNVVGSHTVLLHQRKLEYCSSGGGHVREKYKIQATFSERFELKDMPFDRQLLRMKFVAETELFKMQFAPLTDDAGAIKNGYNPDLPYAVPIEWQVEGNAALQVTKPHEHRHLARFDVLIRLRRKPEFYLWNIVFVLFFLTLASSIVFKMEPHDINSRATVLLTLLLASLAYKIVTASFLPIKPYLTFLDKYILSSFMVQFLVLIECIVAMQFWCTSIKDHDADWIDGKYTGDNTHRTPPSHECSTSLSDFEEVFVKTLYGSWLVWHVVFFVCPRLAFFLAGLHLRAWRLLQCLAICCATCIPACVCERVGKARDYPCSPWAEVDRMNAVLPTDRILKPTGGSPYGFSPMPPLQSALPTVLEQRSGGGFPPDGLDDSLRGSTSVGSMKGDSLGGGTPLGSMPARSRKASADGHRKPASSRRSRSDGCEARDGLIEQ